MKLLTLSALLALTATICATQCEQKIHIKKGKTHTVKLGGTAGTGYDWQYAINKPYFIKIIPQDFKADRTGLEGSSGHFPFTIKGLKPGTVKVTFSYSRPWENRIPLKTEIYTITVKK